MSYLILPPSRRGFFDTLYQEVPRYTQIITDRSKYQQSITPTMTIRYNRVHKPLWLPLLFVCLHFVSWAASQCQNAYTLDLFEVGLARGAQVETVTVTGIPPPSPPASGVCTTLTNIFYSTASTDQTVTVTVVAPVITPSAAPSASHCVSASASFTNFYLKATNIIDNVGTLPNEQAQIGVSNEMYAVLVHDTYDDGYYASFGTLFLKFNTATPGSGNIFILNSQGFPVHIASGFRADVEDGLQDAVVY